MNTLFSGGRGGVRSSASLLALDEWTNLEKERAAQAACAVDQNGELQRLGCICATCQGLDPL